MPALAQTRPLLVSTIRTRSLRTIRARLAEDQLDQPRVLVEPPASSARAGATARRRRGAAAGPRPSRRPSGRSTTTSPSRSSAARRDQLPEPVAGPDLGQAGNGQELDAGRSRGSSPSAARAAEVAGARFGSTAERGRAGHRGRRPVSRSSAIEGIVATRQRTPAARASSRCRFAASGTERGGDGIGRGEDQPVGAVAVTVGITATPRRLCVELAVELDAPRAAGNRPARARRTRRRARSHRRSRASAASMAGVVGVVEVVGAGPNGDLDRAAGSPLTTTIRSSSRDSLEAEQDVGEHRLRERRAVCRGGAAGEPALGALEALDGTIAVARTVPSDSQRARELERGRARPAGARRRRSSACRSARS